MTYSAEVYLAGMYYNMSLCEDSDFGVSAVD